MISRGKSRIVERVHIPNAELRSCAELLFELQKSEGREPCLTKSKTGNQETGAVHVKSPPSIKETCADTLSISPSPSVFLHTQNHSYDQEKMESYSCHFSSCGGALSVAVSKTVTNMARHNDQDERQSDVSLHWDVIRPVLLKSFAKHGARDC